MSFVRMPLTLPVDITLQKKKLSWLLKPKQTAAEYRRSRVSIFCQERRHIIAYLLLGFFYYSVAQNFATLNNRFRTSYMSSFIQVSRVHFIQNHNPFQLYNKRFSFPKIFPSVIKVGFRFSKRHSNWQIMLMVPLTRCLILTWNFFSFSSQLGQVPPFSIWSMKNDLEYKLWSITSSFPFHELSSLYCYSICFLKAVF